jgi:hypothetical protein
MWPGIPKGCEDFLGSMAKKAVWNSNRPLRFPKAKKIYIINVAVGAAKFRGEYQGGMPTIGGPGCNGETMAYVAQQP